ncbi:Ras family GTPase [Histomonas meleagridis]|uniref:Ras family GTPase n=1 Tax=Histomonas meleagridis TaxID=135588 RepID=UPI00355AA892|nr:Ras family GTPase [Histomonas meleagridis]KAH0799768.1 Ras family GTPase [Histomonas meleagridis]
MDTINILLMGDEKCHKTNIILYYVRGEFTEKYSPTLDDDFSKTIEFEGQEITIKISDSDIYSASVHQLRQRSISKYDAFIFLYSTEDLISLMKLKDDYNEIKEVKKRFPCVIGAVKTSDKPDEVPISEGRSFAEMVGCQVVEVNVKENTGINELFDELLKALKNSLTNSSKKPSKKGKKKDGCYVQ